MKLYTVKNNETGEVKGLSQKAVLDLTYFDAIQEAINANPEDFDNDEVKALMAGYDIGWYVQFQNELDQIDEPLTVGRYTISPIIAE